MGTVYEGRDTRLDRTVAIKASAAPFSGRLEREARAVSSLNHPHICTLYDIVEQDGAAYLVMEYIKGTTLADRLAQRPMPFEDVIRYGAQIAAALAAAHARGIVHRDLKPANMMPTADGVKVLDFGLAKVSAAGTTGEDSATKSLTALRRSSARSSTWRRSSLKARNATSGRISSRSAWCCTRWRRGTPRSMPAAARA